MNEFKYKHRKLEKINKKDFDLFSFAGFTEYESKVLSVLAREENATAREISNAGEVPYSKIFSVLSNLRSRGFIQSSFSKPKKFTSFYSKKEIVLRQIKVMKDNILQLEKELIKKLKENEGEFK